MNAEEFSIKHPTGMNDCYWMHVEIASYKLNSKPFYIAMEAYAKYYHEIEVLKLNKANVIKSFCCCKEGKQSRTVDENWEQICEVCGGS